MNEARATPAPSAFSAWYMVVLCMVAYIFSFIDRQVISLLVEPIRADLQISDTQFSLLHGLAFAIFYALMGLPIARLADTRSRPLIIAAGIFVWSIATAACGATKNFWQLFTARMAVGAGEAALSPAAYSMITDSFPRSKLGFALGIYSLGSFIGSGLAYLIGGAAIEWVSQFGAQDLPLIGLTQPWQMTFFIVGIPGVIIAALFFVTIRDPERKGVNPAQASGYPVRDVFRYIGLHRRTFLAHYIGFGFMSLSLFALLSWAPAFLIRNFGLTAREVGLYLGFLVLISNTAGALSSGWLTDWFTRRGHTDAALRSGILGALGLVLPAALFSSIDGLQAALGVFGLAMFFASFPIATSAAALQWMAPNQMRAQVTALFFLFMNLMGITGGATLVALCTDYLFRADAAVGYSMSIIAASAGLCGAAVLIWGLKHFRQTVATQATTQD
ncbi:spinster family MFS transporter [Elongatibacter sediminis]|uniref:MFS transporter n=1 Tax=Elongatibacter sediminis TaxID=3119006 RepID=A0AAW9RCD5_9GAMM